MVGSLDDNFTNEDIKEALSILDSETKRRVEDVRQRIEFMCASLRAQGNTQINRMLKAIRELTVEEFCEKYGADTQYFMSQQTIQRISQTNKKRPPLSENEKSDATLKKRSKIHKIDSANENEKEKEKEEEKDNDNDDDNEKEQMLDLQINTDTGPLFIRLERENQPNISIQLNPKRSVSELGKLSIDAPIDILTQLNEVERSRIHDQIQDIQDQLEDLKKLIP